MTTSAAPAAPAPTLLDEEVIERVREAGGRRLSDILPVVLSVGAFVVAGSLLAALTPHGSLSVLRLVVAIATYAAAAHVQFEVGTGWALPTQLFFVPICFLLPPGFVPVTVGAAAVVATVPDVVRGKIALDRVLLHVVGAWYAFGPALVLVLFSQNRPALRAWPIYLLALAAQVVVNFASMAPHVRRLGFDTRAQLRMMAPALAVDAALAPAGLVVAFAVDRRPAALVLVLPVVGLLAYFARERRQRIDHALELSQAYRGTAFLLGDVIEADDEYTGSHSRDVVDLTRSVAAQLGLSQREVRLAELTALLHDVGKIRIPSEIINKQGPLTAEERAVIETHTVEGERLLAKVGGLLAEVGTIVRSCHERWDGLGYPDRLEAEEIPLVARIVCCCDAYNAMTTDRPYRAARSAGEALAEVERCSGTHFDPAVAAALAVVVREGVVEAAPV